MSKADRLLLTLRTIALDRRVGWDSACCLAGTLDLATRTLEDLDACMRAGEVPAAWVAS